MTMMMMMLMCQSTTWIQMMMMKKQPTHQSTTLKVTRKLRRGTRTRGRGQGQPQSPQGHPAQAAHPVRAPVQDLGQDQNQVQDLGQEAKDQSQEVAADHTAGEGREVADDRAQTVAVKETHAQTVAARETVGLGPGLVIGAQREEVTPDQDLGQVPATDLALTPSGLDDRTPTLASLFRQGNQDAIECLLSIKFFFLKITLKGHLSIIKLALDYLYVDIQKS